MSSFSGQVWVPGAPPRPPGAHVRRYSFVHTMSRYDAGGLSFDGGRSEIPEQPDFSSTVAPYAYGVPPTWLDPNSKTLRLGAVSLGTSHGAGQLRVVGIIPRFVSHQVQQYGYYDSRPDASRLTILTSTITAGTTIYLSTTYGRSLQSAFNSVSSLATATPSALTGTIQWVPASPWDFVCTAGTRPLFDFARSDLEILRLIQAWSNPTGNRAEATRLKSNNPICPLIFPHYNICVRGLQGIIQSNGAGAYVTDALCAIPSCAQDLSTISTGVTQVSQALDGVEMACDLPLEDFTVFLRNSDSTIITPGYCGSSSEWSVILDLVIAGRGQ